MNKKSKKEIFLKALDDSHGIISTACESSNIGRQTYYYWINSDEKFKKKVDDILETQIDFVENKLINQIDNNDTTAIIFYLKTKAKNRGYVERNEITGINGEKLQVAFIISPIKDESVKTTFAHNEVDIQ